MIKVTFFYFFKLYDWVHADSWHHTIILVRNLENVLLLCFYKNPKFPQSIFCNILLERDQHAHSLAF